MSRKPIGAILTVALFAFITCFVSTCSGGTGQTMAGDKALSAGDNASGPWLELKRRNWESNGTDTRIGSDGSYTVTAVYMRTSREVRKGNLSKADIEELVRQIGDARIHDMQDKYSAPFKSEWSWWGYILTVKTARGAKTIRFHSEDETVPESLKSIVGSIMGMTK